MNIIRFTRDSFCGVRVLLRRGNVNNGANVGPGYRNANNGWTNANVNIGGALSSAKNFEEKKMMTPYNPVFTVALAKKCKHSAAVLVGYAEGSVIALQMKANEAIR